MLPPSFGLEVAGALVGIESLLGGLVLLPDLSLPEKSTTLTLLLTLEAPTLLTLKTKHINMAKLTPPIIISYISDISSDKEHNLNYLKTEQLPL